MSKLSEFGEHKIPLLISQLQRMREDGIDPRSLIFLLDDALADLDRAVAEDYWAARLPERDDLVIEEGKYYRDQDGEVWGPMIPCSDEYKAKGYDWTNDEGNYELWTREGFYLSSKERNPFDLIAEVKTP